MGPGGSSSLLALAVAGVIALCAPPGAAVADPAKPSGALTPGTQQCLQSGQLAEQQRSQAFQFLLDRDTRASVDAYQIAIHKLAERYGPLGEPLVPDLLNLGLLYQQKAEYQKAADSFQRALYITRVNDGLYSLNQVPVIDLLIRTSTAAKQWARVDDAYDLMYWIYRRNYPGDDPRLLPVLKRVHEWNLAAYNKKTGSSLEDHYNVATETYSRAQRIISKCTGDPRLAACYMNGSCCAGPGDKSCPGSGDPAQGNLPGG